VIQVNLGNMTHPEPRICHEDKPNFFLASKRSACGSSERFNFIEGEGATLHQPEILISLIPTRLKKIHWVESLRARGA
jgi:hypothetical protein